jgi:DNA invertase Pin-like site-specific DNA recombinase
MTTTGGDTMTTTTGTLRAVIYRRVSTDGQGDSGLGLAAQYATCVAEAERRGWTPVAVSTDVASGATGHRDGLVDALELLRAGAADVLVASHLSRLSRSTLDFAALMERAQVEGWRLVVLDIGVDTTTAAGALTATMVCAAAEYERRLVSERTRAALVAKRDQGATLGRPAGTCGREDVPADTRVAELHREGLSLRGICARLEAEGYRTPAAGQKRKPKGGDRFSRKTAVNGSRWYPTTVKRMLARQGVAA